MRGKTERRTASSLLRKPRSAGRALWRSDERGVVAIILALLLIVLVGFAALVVDLGQIIIVRSELQNASDAGALAGVVDLVYSGSSAAQTTAVSYSTQSSNFHLAQPTPAADAVNVNVVGPESLSVQVERTAGTSSGPVSTIFARIWGIQTAGVKAVAVATLNRKVIGSGPGNLMPFGIYEGLADADGDGDFDKGNWIDIYPHSYSPGNFGLLDLNGGSNSNAETIDWIENGYNGNFVIPEGVGFVIIEGDPGISGGSMNGAIASRIGDRVLFPIFDQVTSQGANTEYRVINLMGGVIQGFQLTGSQSQRNIMVEITDFAAYNLIVGSESTPTNNTVGTPVLIQ